VVLYVRVSSKDQEAEGFSIPAQVRLLREYAASKGFVVEREFVDIETAKASGRTHFSEMLAYVKKHHASCRTILVEKTDRLYRNLKDWVTLDDLDVEIHFVKENEIVSRSSGSSAKLIHGFKVLMAKNVIDNLSEETRKGICWRRLALKYIRALHLWGTAMSMAPTASASSCPTLPPRGSSRSYLRVSGLAGILSKISLRSSAARA
jgi:DNA invertase Pin-like site-specific DNA recombinase